MFAHEQRKFLIGFFFIACVAAEDTGNDFSNNLFSDLAPLLALFGERVTMQFMSQSTGWADNIIIAMAPLGIITAIVSAIRVGGPSWFKAIIGRARESRAVAESELMSSTSNEVCELWNGQEVVRVMGPGLIQEFIILLPKAQTTTASGTESESAVGQTANPETDQEIHIMKLKDSSGYLEKRQPDIRERIFGKLNQRDLDMEKARTGFTRKYSSSKETKETPAHELEGDPSGSSVDIIGTTFAHTPNLTLNVHNQVGRGELYVVAVCGVLLQLGVLAYSGFATYYPALMLLKDGSPVANYAFPCTTAGTLLLVAGILICSHVVEGSTTETTYLPMAGKEARLIWLQTSGTVNDQAFESFAIFPTDAQVLVTTSQGDFKKLGPKKIRELVTVAGAMVCICGFIVQFIGLRGMHWSTSIAQLGSIVVMTILRTWVRRNLAEIPKSQPLLPGHEMDWLAMTLGGGRTNIPWLYPSRTNKSKSSRPWAEDGGWDWGIAGIEDPAKCEKLKRHQDAADINLDGPIPQAKGTGVLKIRSTIETTIEDNHSSSRSNAHMVMKVRRSLGKLADWHGPASAEAISIARAIEITMDALFSTIRGTFTWSLDACGEQICFQLERKETGGWKAFADDIEAALSLWLYSIHDKEYDREMNIGNAKEPQANHGKYNRKNVDDQKRSREDAYFNAIATDDDAWLRAKGTPVKRSLRLLGSYTQGLYQDLLWWMPNGAINVFVCEEQHSTVDGTIEVEAHRLVGYLSNVGSDPIPKSCIRLYKACEPPTLTKEHLYHDRVALAADSYSPLKTLYAQRMFSAFMWSVAKTICDPIAGGADIRPKETEVLGSPSTWQSFTLHNTRLTKMAQDIQSTGLGSLEEIFLSIIPPLSTENKLPRVNSIIEWTRKHAKPHEQLGRWEEACNAYLWLFRTAWALPQQNDIGTKATALLMEYLRVLTTAMELRKAQQLERDIQLLDGLRLRLLDELKHEHDTLASLMGLYQLQFLYWECSLVQEARTIMDEDAMLKITAVHSAAYNNLDWYFGDNAKERSRGVNDKDIFDWTPLHYAAVCGSSEAGRSLLEYGANINAQDIRGQTPLYHACRRGHTSFVQLLLQEGAEINIWDIDGIAPIHYAAISGCIPVVQSLIEGGADINILDSSGSPLLLWATYRGHIDLVEYLWKGANTELRDRNGRAPLHLAVIAEVDVATERVELVKTLIRLTLNTGAKGGLEIEENAIIKEFIGVKDRFGWTPLHLAAGGGQEAVVKKLVTNFKANKESRDSIGQTPLHIAAIRGRKTVIKTLITDLGADKEAKDSDGQTPLHAAAIHGEEDVVRMLITDLRADKEAKDNEDRTPLQTAAIHGEENVIRVLIADLGANKEEKDINGHTPLHLAAANGKEDVVRALIADLGADKEAKDIEGHTPLHLAATYGEVDVVRALIGELGADKEAKNKKDQTPLQVAHQRCYSVLADSSINF